MGSLQGVHSWIQKSTLWLCACFILISIIWIICVQNLCLLCVHLTLCTSVQYSFCNMINCWTCTQHDYKCRNWYKPKLIITEEKVDNIDMVNAVSNDPFKKCWRALHFCINLKFETQYTKQPTSEQPNQKKLQTAKHGKAESLLMDWFWHNCHSTYQ